MSFELHQHNDAPQESGKPEPGFSTKGENLRLTSEMQIELARRYLVGPDKELDHEELSGIMLRWVKEDGSVRPMRFRQYVEANPGILAEYRQNPEEALRKIEEAIYPHAEA